MLQFLAHYPYPILALIFGGILGLILAFIPTKSRFSTVLGVFSIPLFLVGGEVLIYHTYPYGVPLLLFLLGLGFVWRIIHHIPIAGIIVLIILLLGIGAIFFYIPDHTYIKFALIFVLLIFVGLIYLALKVATLALDALSFIVHLKPVLIVVSILCIVEAVSLASKLTIWSGYL